MVVLLVELSASQEGAFPSLRWLAEHIGCSPGSVRQAIREAEELGIVRRAERFDERAFSGGRQTSNRYEIVLHPGLEMPHAVGPRDEPELVIVDDESDPNQLELAEAPAATSPGLAVVRPRVQGSFAAVHVHERAPLQDQPGGPSPIAQGIKDLRERTTEKANSTRVRAARADHAPTADARESAAAFLNQVLPQEKANALKVRFGHQAYGSLLFALRRNECMRHPVIVGRALERLCAASNVTNPGGYFVRVFQDELAAAELAGPAMLEEPKARAENVPRQALVQRINQLNEQLLLVSYDLRARDRLYAELGRAQDSLRQLMRPSTAAAPVPSCMPLQTTKDTAPAAPTILNELESFTRGELESERDALREAKQELCERIERVHGFDGEKEKLLRGELEDVNKRGQAVLALLAKRPLEAEPARPAAEPDGSILPEILEGSSGQEPSEDSDPGNLDDLRAQLTSVDTPSVHDGGNAETALGVVHAMGSADHLIAETLSKLGASVSRPTTETAFAPATHEELEIRRRMQRAALLAIREREAKAAEALCSRPGSEISSTPASAAERQDFSRPGLARVEPDRAATQCENPSTPATSAA